MAEKRRGLGRGLGALIPNNTTPVVTASDVAEKEAEKSSGDSQTSAGGTSRRILGKTPEDSQRKAGAAEKICPEKGTVCDNETDRTAREPHLFVAKGYGSETSGIFC